MKTQSINDLKVMTINRLKVLLLLFNLSLGKLSIHDEALLIPHLSLESLEKTKNSSVLTSAILNCFHFPASRHFFNDNYKDHNSLGAIAACDVIMH